MAADRTPSAWVALLIGLRFLLELALLAAYAVGAVRLVGGALGWALAVVLVAVVATAWGVLLSPRRPVRWPVLVRVVIELALFALAGALLAASGLVTLGAALLLAELAVVGLLRGPDRHAL
jgi:hypothetical protein